MWSASGRVHCVAREIERGVVPVSRIRVRACVVIRAGASMQITRFRVPALS